MRPRKPTPPLGARVTGPGRSIGVAETEPGTGARGFALELARALSARGPVRLVVCDFGTRAPVLLPAEQEVSGVEVRCLAVAPEPSGLAPLFAELGSDERWVCVGEPALALLAPTLSVLLAPSDVRSWPPALLAHATAYQLVLDAPRAGLARALGAQF